MTPGGTLPNYTWALPNNYPLTDNNGAFINGFRDGNNTITISATDARGNTTTEDIKFIIDKSAPVIDVSNIALTQITPATWGDQGLKDAALKQVTVLEGSNPALRGVIEDFTSPLGSTGTPLNPTTGLTPTKLNSATNQQEYYFEYRIYGSTDLTNVTYQGASGTAGGWQDYFIGADPSQSVNFTISLSNKADGLYWLDIKAADRIGNTDSTTVKQIAFNIDKLPPGIRIQTPNASVKNTVYQKYSDLVLTGQAWDGNFKGVTIRVDDKTPEEIHDLPTTLPGDIWKAGTYNEPVTVNGVIQQVTGYNWEWTMPVKYFTTSNTDYLGDGTHSITITAQDNANKTSYVTYTFIKDTTAPIVTLNNLALDNSGVISEDNAEIRMSINDDYSPIGQTPAIVGNVGAAQHYFMYSIYRGATPATKQMFGIGDPGKSVSPKIPLNVKSPDNFWAGNEIPDGVYSLQIEVKDRVGNSTFSSG